MSLLSFEGGTREEGNHFLVIFCRNGNATIHFTALDLASLVAVDRFTHYLKIGSKTLGLR